MARQSTYKQFQALDVQLNHLHVGHDAQQIFDLTEDAIYHHALKSGVEMTFRYTEITNTIEAKPQYRHGYNGQVVEQVIDIQTTVLKETPMILRKRKGQLIWLSKATEPGH